MYKIAVIGSGFSGLSSATYLANMGYEVHVFEKNDSLGGRARQYTTKEGYVFDMGPSWYWMPEVFENYFSDFGYSVSDLYELDLLSPSFDIVFQKETISIPSDYNELKSLFESLEKGAGSKLDEFMKEASVKYQFGMEDMVKKPSLSILEFMRWDIIYNSFKLDIFSSLSAHVRKYFKHPYLISLMEFPVLFLGAMPNDTPSLYSLMNYAGLKLGTWYPQGGFGEVIKAMVKVAESKGVKFYLNANVDKILTEGNKTTALKVNGETLYFDGIIASADYNHVEQKLLDEDQRNYDKAYWEKKTFAPSSLLFYLGINKKIEKLHHHTLFFDESLDDHAVEIYKNPQWPHKPLFYVCTPSKTDASVAPKGHENIFLLMPIAVGLEDNETIREHYFQVMMNRLESYLGEDIRPFIDYKKSFCINDFIESYNSYKGNAYGLANTLSQTAFLKPRIKNNQLENLIYTGQLTVPGPGVPPSLISGKIAADLMTKYLIN